MQINSNGSFLCALSPSRSVIVGLGLWLSDLIYILFHHISKGVFKSNHPINMTCFLIIEFGLSSSPSLSMSLFVNNWLCNSIYDYFSHKWCYDYYFKIIINCHISKLWSFCCQCVCQLPPQFVSCSLFCRSVFQLPLPHTSPQATTTTIATAVSLHLSWSRFECNLRKGGGGGGEVGSVPLASLLPRLGTSVS